MAHKLTDSDRFYIGTNLPLHPDRTQRAWAYQIAKLHGLEKSPQRYPTTKAISRAIEKWQTQQTHHDLRVTYRPSSGRRSLLTEEKLDDIAAHMIVNPQDNQRALAETFGIYQSTISKALKSLKIKPYRIRKRQLLKPSHIAQRVIFSDYFKGPSVTSYSARFHTRPAFSMWGGIISGVDFHVGWRFYVR